MFPTVEIVSVPPDNYCYLLHARGATGVAVIDPGEAEPVRAALERSGLRPSEIWLTHKHGDHIGGAAALAQRYDVPVRGPREIPQIAARFLPVPDASGRFRFGAMEVRVVEIAGHTRHHVVYLVEGAAFTGDALFLGGVGRVFEGTAAELFAGLERALAGLPDDTRVYCGHEYTEKNLRFASQLEPANTGVLAAYAQCRARVAAGQPTVPGELGIERQSNPFLRVRDLRLRTALERQVGALPADPAAVFTALRALRDRFRG